MNMNQEAKAKEAIKRNEAIQAKMEALLEEVSGALENAKIHNRRVEALQPAKAPRR